MRSPYSERNRPLRDSHLPCQIADDSTTATAQRFRSTNFYFTALGLAAITLSLGCQGPRQTEFDPQPVADPVADHKTRGEPTEFKSAHLNQPLLLLPGVFPPQEAEQWVLPFMKAHRELFAGRRVMEIGTGSGMISLFAAQLGAKRIVCTDISPHAIDSVQRNAELMGFADVIDARLVPADDISAYSVIREGEKFDMIISNPPYALDLDANNNTALVDRGDLGLSIVRGFADHLAEGGVAALMYNTLFYHGVMVKYARYLGYEVRAHLPLGLSPWAMEAMFNFYLHRLLQREGIPTDAFRFHRNELPYASTVIRRKQRPLVGDAEPGGVAYFGFMVISRKSVEQDTTGR